MSSPEKAGLLPYLPDGPPAPAAEYSEQGAALIERIPEHGGHTPPGPSTQVGSTHWAVDVPPANPQFRPRRVITSAWRFHVDPAGRPVGCSSHRTPSPEAVVSNEGAGQEIVGTATDKADNTASASVVLNIDKTAPVIALSSRTPANGAGWNNTAVTLAWNCTDALSGPVVNQVAHSLSAEGAAQNAIGTCADLTGHAASDTQSAINIDKTSRVIEIGAEAVKPVHAGPTRTGFAAISGEHRGCGAEPAPYCN